MVSEVGGQPKVITYIMLICLLLYQHYFSTVKALFMYVLFPNVMLYIPYIYMVHLAMILIWRFGGFSSDRQIKITANTIVLFQVLINSSDEQAYPPN